MLKILKHSARRILVLILSIPFLLISQAIQATPIFQQMFEKHDLVMLLIDPASGAIVDANPAATRFYGYSRERLQNMPIQAINILTAEQVAEERRLAKSEQRNYFIFRHRLADESIRTVEVYSYPFDFDGKILLYSMVLDITSIRKLESARRHHQVLMEETLVTQTRQLNEESHLKIFMLGAGSVILLFLVLLLLITRREIVADRRELKVQGRRLADVIEATHIGSWEWDLEINESIVSDRWAEIIGYTAQEISPVLHEKWENLTEPNDLKRSQALLEKLFKGELDRYECELRMRHKNGQWVWILDRGKVTRRNQSGKPVFISGTHQDISERKQTEGELRKLSRAVEYSSSAVFITDKDYKIEYINPKFTEITGYSSEEALGETPRILQSGLTPDSVYQTLRETISSGGEWKGELYNRKKDSSHYWARNSISVVKDTNGLTTHYLSIQDDVTREIELNEQLSYQARHDNLTGLINRNEFERRAEKLLSDIDHDNDAHALCFIDLDQFKVINDTCGHVAGDELLRQLGQVLQTAVRNRDTLARLGGDEFGILIEHCSLDQAQRVTDALRKAVQDFQFSWDGHIFKVSASIGLVAISESTSNLTELLKQADSACYMAKDLGRNRIHVYHPEDAELSQRHGEMQWVSRINRALEDNRFCLYAQPIESLGKNQHRHYELLLRLIDENNKTIPPGAFLSAAERYNLIGQLDRWVVENALTFLTANPTFVEEINFVSINLSGHSLTNGDFLEFVMSLLRKSGVAANKICFEVTETVAISNLSAATTFISILREAGCQFALDDFGSGLSSFGYLKNLPVDYLKIDGMFVKDLVNDPIDHAMVKSINEIGHVMGMETIAEFVENDEIKDMLREIGVDFAQGYGIGKPEPIEKLVDHSHG